MTMVSPGTDVDARVAAPPGGEVPERDEHRPGTDELPELPELPDVPEPQPGERADRGAPAEADLLRAVEEQARRVQAYARDLADLIALGRAVAREPEAVPLVSAPLLDRVPRSVLAELLATGRQLEAATEATFESAGRGDRRAGVRQHAELFAQREVTP